MLSLFMEDIRLLMWFKLGKNCSDDLLTATQQV